MFMQDDGRVTSSAIREAVMGAHACNCVGPQPGFPRCPCQMRGLIKRNGRWIQPEQDLGPVIGSKER